MSELSDLVARALAEDLGAGDATTEAVVPAAARGRARIVQKAPGVLFGLDAAEEAFGQAGSESFDRIVVEGQWRDGVPAQVALVTGPAAALLAGERTALNFLGHLSGIATLTAHYVAAVKGTGARILDTRKTTPGLRALEKAAVVAGGGRNHRIGLYDAILIKENHAALAGGVGEAVRLAAEQRPDLEAEVECRDLDEVREALAAGAGGSCSTTWTSTACARRSPPAMSPPTARPSRRRAASRWRPSARSPPPGSTSSRSGH